MVPYHHTLSGQRVGFIPSLSPFFTEGRRSAWGGERPGCVIINRAQALVNLVTLSIPKVSFKQVHGRIIKNQNHCLITLLNNDISWPNFFCLLICSISQYCGWLLGLNHFMKVDIDNDQHQQTDYNQYDWYNNESMSFYFFSLTGHYLF